MTVVSLLIQKVNWCFNIYNAKITKRSIEIQQQDMNVIAW